MLDRILTLGATFDWISPVLAAILDLVNGPSHTFLVPDDVGWSGREIQRLLGDHGVDVWGLMIVNGTIMLTVRQAQARWAQYLLEQEGIPIHSGLVEQRAAPDRQTRRSMRRPNGQHPWTVLESWLRGLDDVLRL